MEVYINKTPYTINSLEEINTIVAPDEIIELNLKYNKLTELPENIFQYNTNLQTICLNSNKLENLQENLFQYNINLEKVWLFENELSEIPENLFQYNTKLRLVSFYHNKLTQIPEKLFQYNTNLKFIYFADNMLTELPENLFQYNTNLQELCLDSNKLTELPENILRYNADLRVFNLTYNNFTELPANVFRYNTNLTYLALHYNMLTELPENIFRYNTNLYILSIACNKLLQLPENIFRYNTNLKKIYLYTNHLKNLPISLLNCDRLEIISYDNNEINYIPPNMQRFLNRLTNKSNKLQIYNNGQNVHNHEIQESVKNSINNILNIPKTIKRDKIMDLILESKLSETSKRLILEYCNDSTVHTVLNVTFEEVLLHMFQYIVDHLPDKLDNIMQIMDSEMQDSECKCFTGRISRLINCLGGISDLVEVKIPENMERSNIVVMLMKKYEGQELIDHIVKEFTERGYQEYIEEYIEAL